MPEITKADPTQYTWRHIRIGNPLTSDGSAPAGALSNIGAVRVLGKTTTFEELPISELITNPDLVDGTWTARLQDAGTYQIRTPNKTASDGVPWRTRFTTWGRSDWIEIKRGGNLEFVACVENSIATGNSGSDSVTLQGHDAAWCLKSQYERDWQTIQAPRDVMYHATNVAVPVVVDSFLETTLNGSVWATNVAGAGTATISPTTGLTLLAPGANDGANLFTNNNVSLTGKWALSVTATFLNLAAGGTPGFEVLAGNNTLTISGLPAAYNAQLGAAGAYASTSLLPVTGSLSIVMESDGRWLRAYVNGQLAAYTLVNPTAGLIQFELNNGSGAAGASATALENLVFEQWQPFLMAGSDQGDYGLPGTAQTYPTGGLHARYYNDVQAAGLSATNYLASVLNPGKDNPASGQPAPYDVIEATLAATTGPNNHVTSGFATTNWSAKYFGAIYLPLASGNVSLSVAIGTSAETSAVRVWIGQTLFGTQLVDHWAENAPATYTFTVSAANLANGDGDIDTSWYPILIEYAAVTCTVGPTLEFTNLPVAYTDPGGTALASGAQTTVVPSTSLSPLGCVDQRYQGISYFDMYQQTANAFGYQFVVEPMQLESGVFPGQMCPRVREGKDTDEILQADTSDAVSPVINYANTQDATDQVSSMNGIGAGINDGQGSQLQAQVFDLATIGSVLFDMQGWVSATDVAYEALLAQRVASQLALQSAPWQNLTGDPRATDRLADTWPVTGMLSEFHFRPGDGVRFYLPDVGVVDLEPRQITQVTRNFGPVGRTSSGGTPGSRALRPATVPHRTIREAKH